MLSDRQNRAVGLTAGIALLLSVGCNGGSSSGSDADVEGRWETTIENPTSATINGCNGDLGEFNGLTLSDVTAGIQCTPLDPAVVEQSGSDLSYASDVDISCDNGVNQTQSLSGSVNGDEVSVTLTTVGDNGVTSFDFFLGTADGNQIDLEESRFSLSGAVTGACFVTPPLRLTVRIF